MRPTEDEIKTFMERLEDAGFAVAIFTPEEIGDADIGDVEDQMIQAGWDVIGDAGGEPPTF